jgi:predicted transcriptional regulator
MSTIERLSNAQVSDPDPGVEYLSLDDAGPILDVLSSRTARTILNELHREPATPIAITDRIETSIQNVSYHLSKLEDADLVTVVGTRHSQKGREMKVYAPTIHSLVIGGESAPDA